MPLQRLCFMRKKLLYKENEVKLFVLNACFMVICRLICDIWSQWWCETKPLTMTCRQTLGWRWPSCGELSQAVSQLDGMILLSPIFPPRLAVHCLFDIFKKWKNISTNNWQCISDKLRNSRNLEPILRPGVVPFFLCDYYFPFELANFLEFHIFSLVT